MTAPRVVFTVSEAETAAVASALAARLEPNAVVLLVGDLGAGKTAFVRGMAEGLGIDPDQVSSPTFTLVQEYRGSRTLYHVDLYRVEGAEAEDLGLEELTSGGGVVAIEWAEKLLEPIPGAITVSLTDLGGERREIRITGSYSDR
ncbi:MAG: tRNA (adenosine(37)-N6)-threonylcarbamoyltransferase complex ATPase subunit type 1 TsaE [Acidobacteria bacterium]|nr:tRNA (adenosine(37)-N6)-threonylcarbamoyltransferase complex ATPase subunit type 1 TsaE [Acidobacteriota bacterium]